MFYDHIQYGRFHLFLYPVGLIMLFLAYTLEEEPVARISLLIGGLLVCVVTSSFHWLNIRDDGDSLLVRFGPVPILGTRIPYDQIEEVAADKSSFLDGWGVHWTPGRGTTYNIWGFDCVRLRVRGRIIRLGTDDQANLIAFLQEKLRSRGRMARFE